VNCWFWLAAIDANTIQIYKDAALTQLVDLTGGSSGMTAAPRSTLTVATTCKNGSSLCRGQFDTAAAIHTAGAIATHLLINGNPNRFSDGDGGHGLTYRSMLGIAADTGGSIADSVTGATITARRAFQM